jgi:hypothetical protein
LRILEVGSQSRGGLNAGASAGTLGVGGVYSNGTRLQDGEITHVMPKSSDGTSTRFSFHWTAPMGGGVHALRAWGNAVNGNDSNLGDAAAFASLLLDTGPVGPPLCPVAPEVCRPPAVGRKAVLVLKDKTPNEKDLLVWKCSKGTATTKAEFGDPLASDDYALCVYDAGMLVARIAVPAGGSCAGKPCWTEKPTSFVYKTKYFAPEGARQVLLKAGVAEKATIVFQAKGTYLALPGTDTLVGPVDVQLRRNGGGPCFGATYSSPFHTQDAATFKAEAD